MEFVVCDSRSVDGTPELIEKYADHFKMLKIVSKKCTRGEGRQIAFENSRGRYVIQVDLDIIYNDAWSEFLKWHMRCLPDFAVQTMSSGIYPRELIERIGGWRKLNYSEDLDVWIKLARIGKLRWSNLVTGYNFALLQQPQKIRRKIPNQIKRWMRSIIRMRDMMALHRVSWTQSVISRNFQPTYVILYSMAKMLAASMVGVVDVRKCNRVKIIKNNTIELPIDGMRGKGWYWRGFYIRMGYQRDKDCLICGSPIPIDENYCPRCLDVLKRERIIK